jgi:Na+-transporting methylmalonyl-CoA/oxaloacetate decarboxylase gamma subunit
MEACRRRKMFLGMAIVFLVFFITLFPGGLNGRAWGQYDKSSTPSKTMDTGDPVSAANGEYHFNMPLFDLGGPVSN